jgi:hypothetical protein
MEGRKQFEDHKMFRGGRSTRGRGGHWNEEGQQRNQRPNQGGWDESGGDIKEEDLNNQQWRKRDNENVQRQDYYKGQQLHLRHNLNQTREQEKHDRRQDGFKAGTDGNREGGKTLLLKILLQKLEKVRELKRAKLILGYAKGVGKLDTNLKSASNH